MPVQRFAQVLGAVYVLVGLLGFAFTGPVTVYAALQACGVVDDHLSGCFRRGAYS